MSKIDLIIDALLVAESSVWSAKIAEALEAARELKAETQWVGLTDADLMKEFGYTDELLRDTAYRVDQLLEWKNT
jgi:hypothetical protein